MISITETCKEFNKAMGIKGRLLLFVLGFIGLLFPGWVAYTVLSGLAKCTEDKNMYTLLKQLAD